jgi:hypothetical protein
MTDMRHGLVIPSSETCNLSQYHLHRNVCMSMYYMVRGLYWFRSSDYITYCQYHLHRKICMSDVLGTGAFPGLGVVFR